VESEAWLSHPYQFELGNLEPVPDQLELKEPQVWPRYRTMGPWLVSKIVGVA